MICEKDITDTKNCEEGIEVLKKLGIDCGREISRLAKIIHPDCVAIIPLYRSCIVIMQNEEERESGICTIHAYGDPHWLGEDVSIDTLKKEDFHFEFKLHGRRDCPEIEFVKDSNNVRLSIAHGFELVALANKEVERIIDTIDNDAKLDIYDN